MLMALNVDRHPESLTQKDTGIFRLLRGGAEEG
jgi:hypothetical protein